MNTSLLRAIYNGTIDFEELVASKNMAYQQSLKDLDALVSEMEDSLDGDEEQMNMLNDILDLCSEQTATLCEACFECGFGVAKGLDKQAEDIIRMYHLCDQVSAQPEKDAGKGDAEKNGKIVEFKC